MNFKHLSMYYLAGYMWTAGIGFLVAPDWTLRLLQSNQVYNDHFVRMCGALIVTLGILITFVIVDKITAMYRATLVARAFISALIGLYIYTGNPCFAVVALVVVIGIGLTATGFFLDRARG